MENCTRRAADGSRAGLRARISRDPHGKNARADDVSEPNDSFRLCTSRGSTVARAWRDRHQMAAGVEPPPPPPPPPPSLPPRPDYTVTRTDRFHPPRRIPFFLVPRTRELATASGARRARLSPASTAAAVPVDAYPKIRVRDQPVLQSRRVTGLELRASSLSNIPPPSLAADNARSSDSRPRGY